MAQTFFFYDLETSGLNPREDRIMQFAGQRTDMDLNPVGEPYNLKVILNDDTLPSPDALMVTGISPQETVREGLSEAEFSKLLMDEVFTSDTITVGFNNVRFDDEFIRYLFWRNFYDPYEWAYAEGRSRWDMLDVVRICRALRPDGIKWPVDGEGKATNRLELLTKENGIDHANAHDALSDVVALIEVSRLIRDHQPELFKYLLGIRGKNDVQKLVNLDDKRPFVYVSGRYDAEYHKATVAFPLTSAPNRNVLVYDLRHDPADFVGLSTQELEKKVFASWEERKSDGFVALPVKVLQYNRCPAVAPLGVLEEQDGWSRIGLDLETVTRHQKTLVDNPDFAERLRTLYEKKRDFKPGPDAESQLYDAFVPDIDKVRIEAVRSADADSLADFHPEFRDERLPSLLLHYKARNYPSSLSKDERSAWETWRSEHLKAQLPKFAATLKRLDKTVTSDSGRFILEELQLWAEDIMPADDYESDE